MDIYNYLTKDHKKVSTLFKKIITADTADQRHLYFLEIKKELELHAEPEHSTFYTALKKANAKGKDDAQHGDKEHEEIKKALAKLSRISISDTSKWLIQCGELKHIVEHHVEDEETTMFKEAKKSISSKRALELAEEMDALKNKLANSKSFIKKHGVIRKTK